LYSKNHKAQVFAGNLEGDPDTIATGCDQTGGCSGGPWVLEFSGFGGYVNGNFSTMVSTEMRKPFTFCSFDVII
jgi:hypothetical protein